MRVGFIYQHALGGGGYPRDVRWLAGALAKHGAGVTIFADGNLKGGIRDGLSEEVRIAPLQDLSSDTADVYHVFGMLLPKQVWLLSRYLLGKPVIVSPLGHLMPYHLRRRRFKKALYFSVLKPVFRKVPWFHVFSRVEATSVRRYLGDGVRTFEGGLGIFPPSTNVARKDGKDTYRPTRLLFFGRNDVYQKGIDILLEGFELAVRKGANIRLLIAGKPWNNSEKYIKEFIKDKCLEKLIQVLGTVDEAAKWRLLADADYLVFLSRWDGPPRPIREAIAVGTPVIVSPETNMAEMILQCDAGKTVPLDPDEVARAFVGVSRSPDLWLQHREGVNQLQGRLSWERVAEDYIKGYHKVLEDWR